MHAIDPFRVTACQSTRCRVNHLTKILRTGGDPAVDREVRYCVPVMTSPNQLPCTEAFRSSDCFTSRRASPGV